MKLTPMLAAALGGVCWLNAAAAVPKISAELFAPTNVWTLHLRFAPDQWQAMEPKRPEGGGGFGFGRPGGGAGNNGRESMLQGAPGKRNGLSSAMGGMEFEYVHADLDFGGVTFTNVGVRYKGNGTYMESQGGVKRPLKVDLNKFVKGQKLAGVTTLDLQNNTTDAGMLNDTLAYRFFRDAGVPAPRTAYAKVYVDVPGVHTNAYFGLYTMPENVDTHFAKDRFATKEGLILKPVTSRPFVDLGDDWAKYAGPYDPKTKPTAAQKQRVIEFAQFVSHAEDAEFARRLGDFVDLEEFARFLAVTVWLANFDSILDMGQNYYVHLDPHSNKFTFIPWDLDHSFGTFGMKGTQEQREQLSVEHPWTGANRLLERIFAVGDFHTRYRGELARINTTLGLPERLRAQVEEVAAAIRPAVTEEGPEKARRFEQSVAGEMAANGAPDRGLRSPSGGGEAGRSGASQPNAEPPRRRGFGGFGAPSKPVKAFVSVRNASVADQLAGRSKGREIQDQMFGGGGPGGDGFGPGNILAEPMLQQADTDKNGRVSAAEFHALGEKWFAAWDTDQEGEVRQAQISKGLNTLVAPPGGEGPGGGGFGPGMSMGPALLAAMDADHDKSVTKVEFLAAFDRWLTAWDTDKKGYLDEKKLRAGLNKDWAGQSGGLGGPRPGTN